MVFGLFKKRDPICGMKKEKGKGLDYGGNWFCSEDCKNKFMKNSKNTKSCCGP